MMRRREAVCFHLLHGFFGGPSLLGHSIRRDHHSRAVIAGLAVDKNLLAAVIAEQSKESRHVRVFRMEAVPRNRHEAHSKFGHLLLLSSAASVAHIHNDADAHLSPVPPSLLWKLRSPLQAK